MRGFALPLAVTTDAEEARALPFLVAGVIPFVLLFLPLGTARAGLAETLRASLTAQLDRPSA